MKENGLTLIELLVSVVVIAIGLMAISGIFPMGMRARQQAEYRTRAVELAEQKLEQLRVMGFPEIQKNFPMETWIYDSVGSYTRWWSYDTTAFGPVKDKAFFVNLVDSVSFPIPGGREAIGLRTHITPLLH